MQRPCHGPFGINRDTVLQVTGVTGGVRPPEADGDVPGLIFTGFFDVLTPFPAAALPLARELGRAGKILLGSDFPNIPYPYARQLAGLARVGLGDDWLRAVYRDNPVALFGVPAAAGSGGAGWWLDGCGEVTGLVGG